MLKQKEHNDKQYIHLSKITEFNTFFQLTLRIVVLADYCLIRRQCHFGCELPSTNSKLLENVTFKIKLVLRKTTTC